jgi:signal transduction histidine kinase
MDTHRQITVAVLLIASFLALWVFHNGVLLNAARDRTAEAQAEHFRVVGEVVVSKILADRGSTMNEPYDLYSLAQESGVDRLILLDRTGNVRMDSSGELHTGAPFPDLGIARYDLEAVWDGATFLTPVRSDPTGGFFRVFFRQLPGEGRLPAGVLGIRLTVPAPVETSAGQLSGFVLKMFGAMVVIVILYTAVLSMRLSKKRASEEAGQTETMVTAFQGLVRQLKEKEQELESLNRLAEQRAEAVESYNENILQSVASGVITFDRNRIITTFNPAAERVLRLNRNDMIQKPCGEVFGKDSPITRMLEEVLDREMVISRQEFELHRPLARRRPAETPLDWVSRERARPPEERRAERIWVGVSTSLLRDRTGQVIGATFVFTDLTEIKHLQEQVELKRRLTVLGEMSAGIAHEFRNFMGTIMGFAKLISKRLEPQDTRQGMVQAITREIKDMDRLIEQLLSFGRHTDINLAPVDMEAFLHKQILHVLSQAPDIHRPKLKLSIPPDLPRAEIDEVLMRQALNNLLQNALEAMPNGGELRVEVRVLHRSGPGGRTTDEILVEIGDTGTGIPKEKLEKIFLPFFTTKEKGTGMGLALVHKIIVSHNGRIEAESTEGKGTLFRIYLPLKEGLVS